jgi:hypothetical protein
MLPHRDEVIDLEGAFLVLGSTEYYLGLLSRAMDRPEASGHFERAIEVHDAIGAVPWSARARVALADLDASRRRDLLDEASAMIVSTDLAVLRQEIDARR